MKSPTPSGAMPLRIGGIVLAAGAGSRMGYRPKCLMQRDGESLLAGQLKALSQVGVTELLLVLGHHAERIQQEACLRQFPVRTVRNPQPDAGHVGSLRAGLQALSSEPDAVMVVLADQALINAQDMADLVGAFVSRPKGMDMLQPFVQGLPGNPVVFSMSVARQILASDAQVGARQWQQAHPEGLYRWETPNPHYRMDVDNEEDRQTLQALTGHRLCWPDDLSVAPPLAPST